MWSVLMSRNGAPLTRIWCVFETMTDQDIIDHVTGSSVTPPPGEEEDDPEDAQTEAKVPTNTEANSTFGKSHLWLEDEMHLCVLRFLREMAVKQTQHFRSFNVSFSWVTSRRHHCCVATASIKNTNIYP